MSLLNNRYQFHKTIGQGGMGRVYLAMDTLSNEPVVIKECFVEGKAKNIVERIKREYQFMKKVKHPNLVSARDFFQQEYQYFIVMEFVEGITLKDLIRNHPRSITFENQLYIAQKICSVVAMLNENGIIHRDLKPENIILQKDSLEPKLLDLGIAKAINGELATITKTHAIIGTPQYISPEQINPEMTIVKNTDVFALGTMLYQFFSWQKNSPFYGGPVVSTINNVIHLQVPPLTSCLHTTDDRVTLLSDVLSEALHKNPQQRTQSALEMLTMLISCSTGYKTSTATAPQVIETLASNTITVAEDPLEQISDAETPATDIIQTQKTLTAEEVPEQILNAKTPETDIIPTQKTLTLVVAEETSEQMPDAKTPATDIIPIQTPTPTGKSNHYKSFVYSMVVLFSLGIGMLLVFGVLNKKLPLAITSNHISKHKDLQEYQQKNLEKQYIEQKLQHLGFVYLGNQTYSCNSNTYTVREYLHNDTGMEFVKLPQGSFIMGSETRDDEKPTHNVTLDSFLLSKTEVTQEVWKKIMGTTPWKGKVDVKEGNNYAATHISWNDAKTFCKRLGLDIPTEAQWEYACRSGSNDKYYWGNDMNDDYAWYRGNAYDIDNKYAHQVAQKKPNAFGLHDMIGNVWEWCHDWYDKDYYLNSQTTNPKGPDTGFYRVARGGGWNSLSDFCRSRNRNDRRPVNRYNFVGFRLSMSYPKFSKEQQHHKKQSLEQCQQLSENNVSKQKKATSQQENHNNDLEKQRIEKQKSERIAQLLLEQRKLEKQKLEQHKRKQIQQQKIQDLGFAYLDTQTYTCNGKTFTVEEYLHNHTGMKFVKIPAGTFIMGNETVDDEKPAHSVTLDSFLISKTEVTQKVWQKIMGTTPWKEEEYVKEGSNYAATYISWHDAKDFCKNVKLQLPTEAQWEYACRSGSSDKYYWGNDMDDNYAWYNNNTYKAGNEHAQPVAQKNPNAFGLYDMSGNVWEWCQDWYDKDYYLNSPTTNPIGPSAGSYRVTRGGSWYFDSSDCMSRDRYNWLPDFSYYDVGFRLCARIKNDPKDMYNAKFNFEK